MYASFIKLLKNPIQVIGFAFAASTKQVFLALLLVLGLCSACPGGELQGSLCECTICLAGGAVSLTLEDEAGNGIEDFVVEVLFNDESLGQPVGCTPEEREGSNSCSFGSDLGYYYMIVNAPGYASQEVAVRVFDEGEREICCRSCARAREVTLILQPLAEQ